MNDITRLLALALLLCWMGSGAVVALDTGAKAKIGRLRSLSSIRVPPSTKILASTQPSVSPSKGIELNALELCLCGAAATALGDFVMHPIDTIKITQQTACKSHTVIDIIIHCLSYYCCAAVAKGLFATGKDIVVSHGLPGLYHGVVPYLVGDGLAGAIKFTTFELSRRLVERRVSEKYHSVARFLCAAMAMLACSVVLVPGEVIKTRLQGGAHGGMLHVARSIIAKEGIEGLYVGYKALLVRDVPYTILELGLYENLKEWIASHRPSDRSRTSSEAIAAAITGVITALATTPLDLIKTRLMMQSSQGGRYAGVLDAFMSIYREGGIKGLFVGFSARIAWLLPFTMIYLGLYEVAKRKVLAMKSSAASSQH